MLKGVWASLTGNQRLVPLLAKPPGQQDLGWIKAVFERGEMRVIIDRCYPLHELPEALRCLAGGHARGKIIMTTGAEISGTG